MPEIVNAEGRPPRYYIASGLENHAAVRKMHKALGWECTFDWTEHVEVDALGWPVLTDDDVSAGGDHAVLLGEVAIAEIAGVIMADLVIVQLPGLCGTYAELGAALATGTPVLIVNAPNGAGMKRALSFHEHPMVTRVPYTAVWDQNTQEPNELRSVALEVLDRHHAGMLEPVMTISDGDGTISNIDAIAAGMKALARTYWTDIERECG